MNERTAVVMCRAVGGLLMLATLWTAAYPLLSSFHGRSWLPLPGWNFPDFFCLCHWIGLLLGIAMLARAPRLATFALVGWVLFPLASTLEALYHGWWPPQFVYRLVMLVAVPVALATRLYRRDLLLPAIGAACLAVFAKGAAMIYVHIREEPIWLVWLLGHRALRELFVPTQVVFLAIGLACLGAWWFRRRLGARHRLRREPAAP